MRSSLALAVLCCCICTFAIGNPVAAAAEPAAAQGAPVSTDAGEAVAAHTGAVSPEPTDLKLLALDKLKSADAVRGLNVGLCPAQLRPGLTTTSGASTACRTDHFGQYLCVTCCTCIVAGGVTQCDCATDCVQT